MDRLANQALRLENAVSVATHLYAGDVVTKQWRLVGTKIRNFVESGRKPADGHPAQCQQPALRAHGENPGDATGIIERVVESARLGTRHRACKVIGFYCTMRRTCTTGAADGRYHLHRCPC